MGRICLYFALWILIQGLIEEGAQTIAVVGLPPIGCLPIVINANSRDAMKDRNCIDKLSWVAKEYNQQLQKTMNSIQQQHPNSKLIYGDIFHPLEDMTKNPQKYGTYFYLSQGLI